MTQPLRVSWTPVTRADIEAAWAEADGLRFHHRDYGPAVDWAMTLEQSYARIADQRYLPPIAQKR